MTIRLQVKKYQEINDVKNKIGQHATRRKRVKKTQCNKADCLDLIEQNNEDESLLNEYKASMDRRRMRNEDINNVLNEKSKAEVKAMIMKQ